MANLSSSKVSVLPVMYFHGHSVSGLHFCSMQKCRLHQEAGVQSDSLCRSYFTEPFKWKISPLVWGQVLDLFPPPFRFLPLTWKWHQPSPIRNPPAVSTHLTWTKPSHWSPSQKRELLRLSPAGRTNITNILKLLFEFTEARYRFWKKWGRAERKTLQWKKLICFFLSPTPSMMKNSKISNVLFSIHTINKKETFP